MSSPNGEGILKGYLYDRLTALEEGVESSGNGRRESYQHKPIPRMSNAMILPGKTNPGEILRSVEKGLLVKKWGWAGYLTRLFNRVDNTEGFR
jgi:TldD protein